MVDPDGEFPFLFAAAVLVGGTFIGGVSYAAYDVSFNQGFGRGGHNEYDFGAIDWDRTGDKFRVGANTGMAVSSFIVGVGAGSTAARIGGTQGARYLAGMNALDVGYGIGADMLINGDSFGQAAFWNVAAFGAGEVVGGAFGLIGRRLPNADNTISLQDRAERLMEEAAQISNARLDKYVDRVVYDANAPVAAFSIDEYTGERVVTLNQFTMRQSRTEQLLTASHEFVHAQQFELAVRRGRGSDFDSIVEGFFTPPESFAYAWDEVIAETLALRRLHRYLGDIPEDIIGYSVYYANDYRQVTQPLYLP